MLLQVPIYVRALDLRHAAELKDAGASNVITATVETGLVLGSSLLQVSPALTQGWKLFLWLQLESDCCSSAGPTSPYHRLLQGLGAKGSDLQYLKRALRKQLDARAADMRDQMQLASAGAGQEAALPDVFVFDQSKVWGHQDCFVIELLPESTCARDDPPPSGLPLWPALLQVSQDELPSTSFLKPPQATSGLLSSRSKDQSGSFDDAPSRGQLADSAAVDQGEQTPQKLARDGGESCPVGPSSIDV